MLCEGEIFDVLNRNIGEYLVYLVNNSLANEDLTAEALEGISLAFLDCMTATT